MKILAIETSCDETSAAIVEDRKILSNIISSQVEIHKKYGGVVPILAKREHQKRLPSTIKAGLGEANVDIKNIDYIAVTQGPGLGLALGVGVEYAKKLAIKHNKPLIAVNHLEAHLLSSLALDLNGEGTIPNLKTLQFPLLGFLVSGGHTQLVLVSCDYAIQESRPVERFGYKVLGTTLDDAAGEALDKFAKMLELGYPGGPVVEKLAKKGDKTKFDFPRPMSKQDTYNFSFSGLKTAGKYQIQDLGGVENLTSQDKENLCASYQEAVFDSLLIKIKKALQNYQIEGILIGGGVFFNKILQTKTEELAKEFNVPVYKPYTNKLYVDNAGMIGVVAYFKALQKDFADPETLDWDPRQLLN